MDIKHLEFFAAVAQCGSINKAAQELYISQPHLSHIIKDIESDLGFALFQRTQQGVVLTEDGKLFLEHSNVILKEMESIKKFSRRTQSDKDCLTVSMTKFSHTMESFNEVCSNSENRERFSYSLTEGAATEVIDDIVSGTAAVGVIHIASKEAEHIKTILKEKGVEFTHIALLKPYICVSKTHQLILNNQEVTLAALQDYGFVRYFGQYEDFIYHITTKNNSIDLNSSPKIAYVYGRASLLHLISCSNFYSIGIKEFSTQNSMYNVLSVPIKNCTEKVEFGIITLKGAELTDSACGFIDNVTDRYQRLEKMDS